VWIRGKREGGDGERNAFERLVLRGAWSAWHVNRSAPPAARLSPSLETYIHIAPNTVYHALPETVASLETGAPTLMLIPNSSPARAKLVLAKKATREPRGSGVPPTHV